MIELIDLTKKYGDHTAVSHVNCKLPTGHVYGLLGLNGAGKSTTMNMMTGCLAPTAGTVRINGFAMDRDPIRAKRCIGYLPEIPPLYPDMTVAEYLCFVAEARGVRGDDVASQVRQVMELTDVAGKANRLTKLLSKGNAQRVGIASTLLGNPDIIILDEPTVGLDPVQIIEIRNLVRRLGETKTVIISSHILSEVAELCDHVLILSEGNLICDSDLDTLLEGGETLEQVFIRLTGAVPEPAPEIPAPAISEEPTEKEESNE